MRVLVMGAGAIGCIYGGLLREHGHAVTFVVRGPHLEAMRERGLELRGHALTGLLPGGSDRDTRGYTRLTWGIPWTDGIVPAAGASESAIHNGVMARAGTGLCLNCQPANAEGRLVNA